MDASRTHEVAHVQSIWTWVVIGAVGLALAVAITVGVGMNTDDVVVKAPARTVVDAGAGSRIGPATRGFAEPSGGQNLHAVDTPSSAGAMTGIRQGHAHPGAIPDSFTDGRGSGAYFEGQDGTAIPRRGLCPVKQGC